MGCRAYRPVVSRHNPEAFRERCFAVFRRHPFLQIIYEDEAGVVQGLGLLHYSDAPVEVGRETVLQVVWLGQGGLAKKA